MITLAKIVDALGFNGPVRTSGDLSTSISHVTHDSREVRAGSIYVALKGLKTDGHSFISGAIENGAAALAVASDHLLSQEIPALFFKDTRSVLGHIASALYENPSAGLGVIGITGTNGKTTTAHLIEEVLRHNGAQVGITGTIAYRFGEQNIPAPMTTPESSDYQRILRQMLDEGADYVVSEISSHALVLQRCQGVEFDVAIFTNLSRDHLDFHSHMDEYFAAKALLFEEHLLHSPKKNRAAVINIDDPYGARLLQALKKKNLHIVTFGFKRAADVRVQAYTLLKTGIEAMIHFHAGEFKLLTPLLGLHNLSNCLAALACGEALGLDVKKNLQALAKISFVRGRLQPVGVADDPTVLVDYAHTPDALQKVLEALRPLLPTGGQLACVFGCGGDRDPGKRPLMGQVVSRLADFYILTSDNPRSEDPNAIIESVLSGIDQKTSKGIVEPDRRSAIEKAIARMSKTDILLIAGKGHEDYQIIREVDSQGKITTKKIHFDDCEEAQRVLEKRR